MRDDPDILALMDAKDEIARLRAEVEALHRDAERYRWLRSAKTGKPISVATTHSPWNTWINTTELDAAIDAAIAAQQKE